MLPRRAEHLCVTLSPAAVSCAVWAGRGRGEPAVQASLPCVRDPHAAAWRPPVEALREWVQSLGARRGDARIVLSNHFVRYLVAPWQGSLSTPAEREAFARHLFRERHGEIAEHWHVKVSHGGWGEPALACAVDAELHRALPEAFVGTGWRLGAAEPLLMTAFNRFRREIGNHAALFVREPGRLCCGVVARGRWVTVHAARADLDTPIDALVARATHVLGLDEDLPRLVLDTTGTDDAHASAGGDAPGYRLLDDTPSRRPERALALLKEAA